MAAWIFMPWSTTLDTNCACAWAWLNPPMMPNAMRMSPFVMNAGMIVCSGRLRAGEFVRMARLQREQRAAIVEHEARAFDRDARPPSE